MHFGHSMHFGPSGQRNLRQVSAQSDPSGKNDSSLKAMVDYRASICQSGQRNWHDLRQCTFLHKSASGFVNQAMIEPPR